MIIKYYSNENDNQYNIINHEMKMIMKDIILMSNNNNENQWNDKYNNNMKEMKVIK